MSNNCDLNLPLTANPTEIMLAQAINDLRRLIYSPTFVNEVINKPVTTNTIVKKGTLPVGITGDKKWIDTKKVGLLQTIVSHIGPDGGTLTQFPPIYSFEITTKAGENYLTIGSNITWIDNRGHAHHYSDKANKQYNNIPLTWVPNVSNITLAQSTGNGTITINKNEVLVLGTRSASTTTWDLKQVEVVCHDNSSSNKWGVYINDSDQKIHLRTRKIWVLLPTDPAMTSDPTDYTIYTGSVCP